MDRELKAIPSSHVRVGAVLVTSPGNLYSVRAIAHLVLGFNKKMPRDARSAELGSAIGQCLDQLARQSFRRLILTTLFNDVRDDHHCV